MSHFNAIVQCTVELLMI